MDFNHRFVQAPAAYLEARGATAPDLQEQITKLRAMLAARRRGQ